MAFTLIIGNKNYSSWSMRAWLLMEFLEIPYQEISVSLYSPTSRSEVLSLGGATGLVPVLRDGAFAIWDTLAIIEYLFETHPQVWPSSKNQRARARSICGEAHSGLNALREAMPVNTRKRDLVTEINAHVEKDILRVIAIWENCLSESEGPWLFGKFTAADIVFAPIATRFQTYGITTSALAKSYQEKVLSHPLVVKWLKLGAKEKEVIYSLEKYP